MKKLLTTLILTAAVLLTTAAISSGLPRFAAKAEQKCNLCHVGPTGGGMRNSFGSQFFGMTELAAHSTPFEEISEFNPRISEILSLGMDMRSQYVYDESSEISTFFQMEGNFYVSADLNERFSLNLNKGLYQGFEIYGMGYILPYKGYFRIGKFQPAYGWRFADHTSFVREKMLWPPNSTDTGFELGVYPHGISANVGFFNGSGGMFDDGKGKAISTRVEARKNIGGLGLGLGGSYYLNDGPAGDKTMYGSFYYANLLHGKIIYLGEFDWLENKESVPSGLISLASTQKLSLLLRQGIWLEGSYDFYDPDIDIQSGTVVRYGLGLDYFPYGFLEIEPNIRYYDDSYGLNEKYILFNAQFHFFF